MEHDYFPTSYVEILARVAAIDPVKYGQSRNYLDGAVTRLSPYISRGVISTHFVYDSLLQQNFDFPAVEKLVQELAWRDYWQLIWVERQAAIEADLRSPQLPVVSFGLPVAFQTASTCVEAIDAGIQKLYSTGYMHNHMRMYVASLVCNFAHCHWKEPARWMYYHLLDGDWASNVLSWQWVAGSNSNKKYVFNQENLNKYSGSAQRKTFLDTEYEDLPLSTVPAEFHQVSSPELSCMLPLTSLPELDHSLPLLIYTSYNLDPVWQVDIAANRILLLEPSHFANYPVSEKVLRFIFSLSANIKDLKVFVGEFSELKNAYTGDLIRYKEHPFSSHFTGIEDKRSWLTTVSGEHSSFFAYWKKAKRQLE